uniref:Ras-GAP domain-containing protein n=1 Tax=Amphimedon queenslandica TaxID=400682 RepID=A0A1X7SQI5_AMPQE
MTDTTKSCSNSLSPSSSSYSWWPVIRELRQDQEVISERWQSTRRQYNQLNISCDQLLESLWIEHALSYSLTKVLSHRSPPADWMATSREADSITFLNASQRISSPNLLESYSRFLGNLRSHPEAVAEVLKWAGQEGLDSAHLTYDLVSVVYGHCVFPEDHAQLLNMICHLLMHHIKQCSSIKEMFSIEPVCSRVMSEYCQQLPGLKSFLSQVLRKPLMSILNYTDGYLDYDVTKASARLQGTDDFDVSAYIESSSRFISSVCGEFLVELNRFQEFFPPTLKWLLHRLKKLMKEKWPLLSVAELRRPVSYMLFGFIISSAFVNPDLLGIMDVRIVLDEVAWYNISQVIGVLQGCAWIIDKVETSDYPMRRVVRYMDM